MPPFPRKALFEALEPRLLLSADIPALGLAQAGVWIFERSVLLEAQYAPYTQAFELPEGAAISVRVSPASSVFQPTVSILDPNGEALVAAATSNQPGESLWLEPRLVPTGGTYLLQIEGADEPETRFDLTVLLNADFEREGAIGENDGRASAQSLDSAVVAWQGDSGIDGASILGTFGALAFEDFQRSALQEPEWSLFSDGASNIYLDGDGPGAQQRLSLSAHGGRAEATWTVDLDGAAAGWLLFDHFASYQSNLDPFAGSFTGHADADGVAISVDGIVWYPVHELDYSYDGPTVRIDLGAAAQAAGITLGAQTQIRFQLFDGAVSGDYSTIDNVRIVPYDGDVDWYRVTLEAGVPVTFSAYGSAAITQGEVDLGLYSPDGVLLTETSVVGSRELRIDGFVPFVTSDYLVRVAGDTPGRYLLTVTRGATLERYREWAGDAQQIVSGAVLGSFRDDGLFPEEEPSEASVWLPATRYDGNGFTWEIGSDGAIGASFDPYFLRGLALDRFVEDAFVADLEDGGREIVLPRQMLGDFEVVRKIQVDPTYGFVRYLERVTNLGAAFDVFQIGIESAFATPSAASWWSTASGDAQFGTDDTWVAVLGPTEPWWFSGILPTAFVVGDGRALIPAVVGRSDDNTTLRYGFDLALEPGETRAILHFLTRAYDEGSVKAQADELTRPHVRHLRGLSATERAAVANFDLSAVEGETDVYVFRGSWGYAAHIALEAVQARPSLGDALSAVRIEVVDPYGEVVASTLERETSVSLYWTGDYQVRLTPIGFADDYVLRVAVVNGFGQALPPAPLTVASSTPTGTRADPTEAIDIILSRPINPMSVDVSDLVVGAGSVVTGALLVEPDQVRFLVATPADEATVTYSLAAGAFYDLSAIASAPFSGSYRIDRSGPQMIRQVPGDLVGTPLNFFTLVFDEAIDPASVSVDMVTSLVGPAGDLRDAITSVQLITAEAVLVSTAPQIRPGTYSLSIAPVVRDLLGNAMDQNRNGVGGEPEDGYTATVGVFFSDLAVESTGAPASVDLGGAFEVRYTVRNIGNNSIFRTWTDRLYLSTDAVLDAGDRFLDSWGGSIFSLLPGESYSASLYGSLQEPIGAPAPGEYFLLVAVDWGRSITESDETNNLAALPFQITLAPGPDLVVTAVDAPAEIRRDAPSTVRWTVTNQGETAVTGWADFVILSRDSVFGNGNDITFGSLFTPATLAPGESIELSLTRTPSAGVTGQYHVIVRTDAGNAYFEYLAEDNNARASDSVTTVVAPDLVVAEILLPELMVSGRSIPVSWAIENRGPVTAIGPWTDLISLAADTQAGNDLLLARFDHTGDLAPGQRITLTQDVFIPAETSGPRWIVVRADAFNLQDEIDGENNNVTVSASPINVVQTPSPDLIVSAIEVPAAAVSGEPLLVSWTVTNAGNLAANGVWIDQLRLSDDATVGEDLLLREFAFTGTLAPGASVTRTQSVTLPIDLSGSYRLVVWTDVGNTIVELGAEGNNASISTTSVEVALKPVPDLIVSAIDVPIDAISGQSVPVTWTITNLGNAPAVGGWWDTLYLSDDETIGGDRYANAFFFDGDLAPGESVNRTQNIVLPLELAGPYRIVVHTDSSDRLYERTGETSNRVIDEAPIAVRRAQIPNLRVTEVVGPDEAFSREQTVVRWTVSNDGTAATGAPVWYDAVYLSVDDRFDAFDVFLGRVANASFLRPGESYASMLTVTLPRDVQGIYYFLVNTDDYDQVPELEGEADNVRASLQVPVTLTSPPDLQVATVFAPSTTFSGQPVEVTWEVVNAGAGRNFELGWTDRVYFSADEFLDGGDLLLGSFSQTRLLLPQERYSETRGVQLPVGVTGDFHFLVWTDAFNAVYEGAFESNNVGAPVSATRVLLTPPPDLEAEVLQVPALALAGDPLQVRYRVTNFGATATPDVYWVDRLYLSLDPVLDASDTRLGDVARYGALDVGESYEALAFLPIPVSVEGEYFVLVHTDAGERVFELDNANNVTASDIRVSVAWIPPDLAVEAIRAPAVAASGSRIVLDWTVRNVGAGDTVSSYWLDALYLSRNDVIDGGDDQFLGFFARNGALDPGAAYTTGTSIALGQQLEGDYHLIVQTDAVIYWHNVADDARGNNVYAQPFRIVRDLPDLQITALDHAAAVRQGEPLVVDWRVENRGTARTPSGFWSDAVYLSLDPLLDPATDFPLGSVSRTNPLAPDEGYAVSRAFTVGTRVPVGEYYVLVATDWGNAVFEGAGDLDNVRVSDLRLSVLPPVIPGANLQVAAVTVPPEAFSGQMLDLAWTVTNVGTERAAGAWFDAVYLSRDLQFDRDVDVYLGFQTAPGELDPGASYDSVAQFRIPAGRSGPHYVLVVADSGARLPEFSDADNVGSDGRLLDVLIPPPADLVAGQLTVPADGVPGRTAAITYTVSNDGVNPALGSWTDSLYLSADERWGLDDLLVGSVQVYGPLAPGEGYTRTLTARMPGVVPGDYHLIVRSDVRNHVIEADEDNNLRASLDAVAFDVETLTLGVASAGTLEPGQFVYYRFDVGADEAVAVRFDSSGGPLTSNHVFVRYGSMPTLGEFDHTGDNPLQPDQEVIVPLTRAGTYYVLVAGDGSPGVKEYSIRADVLPFELRRTSVPVAGNTGRVTFLVHGSRFDETTTFHLFDAAALAHEAVRTRLLDASRALVTFDLTSAAAGTARLAAEKGEAIAILDEATTIEDGGRGEATFSLEAPAAVGPGAPVTIYVAFGNGGKADIELPLLILTVEGARFVGRTPSAPLADDTALILGIPNDPIDTVLRPGDSARVPVFVYAPFEGAMTSTLYALDMQTGRFASTRFDYDELLQAVPGGPTPAWRDYIDDLRGAYGEDFVGFYRRLIAAFDAIVAGGVPYTRLQYVSDWAALTPDKGTLIPRPLIALSDVIEATEPAAGDEPPEFFAPFALRSAAEAMPESMAFAATAAPTPAPADGVSKTFVVAVGVSDYNSPGLQSLPAPQFDAQQIRDYFKQNGIPDQQIVLMKDTANDGRVLRPADVLNAIGNLPADADDRVVVYFSGHGAQPSGEWLFGNGSKLTPGDLSSALDRVGGSRYVIADACFSQSFVDGLSSGSTVGMAASNVLSNDQGSWNGSEFTRLLLEQLRNGKTLGEAFEIVQRTIRERHQNASDPLNRTSPYSANPDNIDLGRFWEDPARAQERLQQQMRREVLRTPELNPAQRFWRWWSNLVTVVVTSSDPNDIIGPEGFAAERFVAAAEPLAYTIRFENEPTATAPAQFVRITQRLDPDLDPRTFRLGDFGWGDQVFTVPTNRAFFSDRLDFRASHGYLVEVSAGIDVANAEAFWTFTTIDPLTGQRPLNPLIGFLPPDDPDGVGDGFVTYSVKARRDAPSGAVIDAQARIVFDINEPIDTPPIFNTLDSGRPTSRVTLEAFEAGDSTIVLSWLGRDDEGGSGVRDYTIFVSRDGGAFEPWLIDVAEPSAVYTGMLGRSYGFVSVARDHTGNREALRATPDATVRLLGAAGITGTVFEDLDADGVRSEREPGIGNVTVFLDFDGDGLPGDNEPSILTDTLGRYAFNGLGAGEYRVLTVRAGQTRSTAPASGVHVLRLGGNETRDAIDFGWYAPLTVIAVTPGASGVHVRFNTEVDPAAVNLYGSEVAGLGAADVVLRAASSGAVRGSLVFDADQRGMTFLKTGGVLSPDRYTLTLRGGPGALRDGAGGFADAGDGLLFRGEFTLAPTAAPTLALPDVARGPGQTVDVPATGTGLPIYLTSTGGVAALSFTLHWNPELLVIHGVTLYDGLAAGTALAHTLDAGVLSVAISAPQAIAAGRVPILHLDAEVPASAPYGASHVLDLGEAWIGGSQAGVDDDAIHLVAYLGDADGSADYTTLDVQQLQRVIVRYDSGFAAYPNVDPVVVGDINGNGSLTSLDATRLLQEVNFLTQASATDRPEIPSLPVKLHPLRLSGHDPLVIVPTVAIVEARQPVAAAVPDPPIESDVAAPMPLVPFGSGDPKRESASRALVMSERTEPEPVKQVPVAPPVVVNLSASLPASLTRFQPVFERPSGQSWRHDFVNTGRPQVAKPNAGLRVTLPLAPKPVATSAGVPVAPAR